MRRSVSEGDLNSGRLSRHDLVSRPQSFPSTHTHTTFGLSLSSRLFRPISVHASVQHVGTEKQKLAVAAGCVFDFVECTLTRAFLRITDFFHLLLSCNSQGVVVVITPECAKYGLSFQRVTEQLQGLSLESLPVIVLDASHQGFAHYLCANDQTAAWINRPERCTVINQPVGMLSNTEPVFELKQPFMLCLDIDDTFLHLGASVLAQKYVVNRFLLEFIRQLQQLGKQFEVCFITARYDVRQALEALENRLDLQSECNRAELLSACRSRFSVSKLTEEFKKFFPDVNFVGTHYSRRYVVGPQGAFSDNQSKGDVLVAQYPDLQIVLVDNSQDEITQAMKFPDRILPVLCADTQDISPDTLGNMYRILDSFESDEPGSNISLCSPTN